MIKVILFDFDGVILDGYEKHFELSQKAFKNLSREEHKSLFDGNIHEVLKTFSDRATGFHLPDEFIPYKMGLEIEPAVAKALRNLSTQFTLGIISSEKEHAIKGSLEKNNLLEQFSFIYGEETHHLKVPKFNQVLKEFKIDPKETIYVADTLGDIIEARKAGVETIAVDFGFHDRERLKRGNPLVIISSIKELEGTIEKIIGVRIKN